MKRIKGIIFPRAAGVGMGSVRLGALSESGGTEIYETLNLTQVGTRLNAFADAVRINRNRTLASVSNPKSPVVVPPDVTAIYEELHEIQLKVAGALHDEHRALRDGRPYTRRMHLEEILQHLEAIQRLKDETELA